MRPVGHDLALVDQHHSISQSDRGGTVSDDDRRTALHHFRERSPDLVLLCRVDRRGRVVEDQDARVGEHRTRDGDALTLTTGERVSVLADDRVVPLGEVAHELVGARELGGPYDGLGGRFRIGERDVVAHAVGEQERVFEDETDGTTHLVQSHPAHIGAVDPHVTGVHVVEAREEPRNRGLAGSRRADERDRLAAFDEKVETVEHRRAASVTEGHPLEADRARAVGQRAGVRRIVDGGIGREDRIDTTGGGGRAGKLTHEHPDHAQRPDEHEDEEVRGDDVADGQLVVEHLMPAVPQDADEAEGRQQVDEGHEVRAQACLVHRAVVDTVGLRREPGPLHALDPEALDHTHARDTFLDDSREVRQLLLELHADRVHAVVEPGGGEVEQGQETEREQRESRTPQQQNHGDRDHLDGARDRQRHEQHDVVYLLNIGVRVGHQLAGLRLVVEREVQALEVRDELLADVGFDAPRETERRVAAQPGADGLDRTNRDDRGGEDEGQAGAALCDPVVDRRAREQRNRDARDGPHESGENAENHEMGMCADRLSHQAPALFAGLRTL